MKFCPNCKKMLQLREEIHHDKRVLFYFCKIKACHYIKLCTNFKIAFTTYHKKIQENINMFKFKSSDNTLPQKGSKCPVCEKYSKNRYERKYCKNRFFIINICRHCYHHWT